MVAEKITHILQIGGVPLSLAGDHFLVFPILCALAPHHPELTLVQFDTHPDISGITANLCAKLVKELISQMVQGHLYRIIG